jgi:hypothetical protein
MGSTKSKWYTKPLRVTISDVSSHLTWRLEEKRGKKITAHGDLSR